MSVLPDKWQLPIIDNCELPCGAGNQTRSSEEQPVLLTVEPSLQLPHFKTFCSLRVWWYTWVILVLGRARQEDQDLGASQGYVVRLSPKTKQNLLYSGKVLNTLHLCVAWFLSLCFSL